MVKEFNVLISGSGGQGVIALSEMLGWAALQEDIPVKGTETLGMAQRGGTVTSIVRLGTDVYAGLMPVGKCDVLVGMEFAETLRNAFYLSKSSLVLSSSRRIFPFTVSSGASSYPSYEQVLEKLREVAGTVVVVEAEQLARESGNPRSENVVMIGALAGTHRLPVGDETLKNLIKQTFPKQAEANMKAFDLGYSACQQWL
ncbi:MAG: indolepyruvate oxidoreductase subunit beta [Chloroflexota bacterium]